MFASSVLKELEERNRSNFNVSNKIKSSGYCVASIERVPINLHVSGQIVATKLPVGRPKW